MKENLMALKRQLGTRLPFFFFPIFLFAFFFPFLFFLYQFGYTSFKSW